MSTPRIKPAPVRKSLTVPATPARAFEIFTAGFDRWWPREHTIGKGPLKEAELEQRAGGRWYGVDDDGTQTKWGDVLVWEPPARLLLAWRIGPDWQFHADLHTEVEVKFTALADGQTRVDFEHRYLERMGDGAQALRDSLDGGWAGILQGFAKVVGAG
jgi:hypothetical protein